MEVYCNMEKCVFLGLGGYEDGQERRGKFSDIQNEYIYTFIYICK